MCQNINMNNINHFGIVVDINLLVTIDVDDLMCKKYVQ